MKKSNYSKQQGTTKEFGTDDVVRQFADQMISTIESLKQGWRKTWITTAANGEPMNLSGRNYSSLNKFFLYLLCEAENWKYPVFLTIKQANAVGCHIKKGSKSAPVLFWSIYARNKAGKKVTLDELHQMPKSEQSDYETIPVLKYYRVFNIEQTDIEDIQPEQLKKVLAGFTAEEKKGTDGMYVNEELDKMIEYKGWICDIRLKEQDRAYYTPTGDFIMLPTKEQFNLGNTEEEVYISGMEFYSTMLHEMTHSTGSEKHLNRLTHAPFGSPEYAREELVAELTSALVGHGLGFNTQVSENNAAYLDSWLKSLKKEPKFLISVLADVGKASKMIEESITKMKEVA